MSERALDRMLRAAALFDLYGGLLTERQREFYDLHYMRDLSLAEISEHYGVSRQAVHDTLTRGECYLERVEASLRLLERIQAVLEVVSQAGDTCRKLQDRLQDQLGDSADETHALIEQLVQDLNYIDSLLRYGSAVSSD